MKLDIQILTDESSWMNKYNSILNDELIKMRHQVELIHSKSELRHGEVAFLLSCFELIPQKYLDLHSHNIVVHASDLPHGKGWSPTTWQILEGKNDIPLTLFEAIVAMDAGDYYIKDTLHLDGSELIDEWQSKLGEKIIDMCLQYIINYDNILSKPQQGKESVYPRRNPQNSELDCDKTIREQFNLLRVVDNEKYPAFFNIDGKEYVLKIYPKNY